eukprot:Hpha_TRINITY_DN15567_c0_g1::TRINITY_DN15567_c0_g1_i3::g.106562::m.106562
MKAMMLVTALLCGSAMAKFNFTTCPAYFETQNPKVATGFNISKMPGTFYEQALHDYTQYPTCPSPSCIRSVKEFTPVGDGHMQIKDSFSLECFGTGPDKFPYFFNTTGHNGFLTGFIVDPPAWWKLLGFGDVYPNTIIDYKESADGGQYDWVIEFQCRAGQSGDKVKFTGFNFYTREPTVSNATYTEMIQSATNQGLDFFFNAGFGLRRVPQDNCKPIA